MRLSPFLALLLAAAASAADPQLAVTQTPGALVVATESTKPIAWEITPVGGMVLQQDTTFKAFLPVGSYRLLALFADGTARWQTVIVGDIPTPDGPTAALTCDHDTIKRGESATLTWTAGGNANKARLDGVDVGLTGTKVVSPQTTTDYLFESTDGKVIARAQRRVTVTDTPPPEPVKTVFAVIVYESGQDLKPELSEILRGKQLQDWFVSMGWVGDDKLPTLVRCDKDTPIGNLPAAKAKFVTTAIEAAKASGKPLPLVCWSGAAGGPLTVEPVATDVAKQIERFKTITSGK